MLKGLRNRFHFVSCNGSSRIKSMVSMITSVTADPFPFLTIVVGYQNIIGPIKGSYCPMYPSCSHYGYDAIQRYNIQGVLMSIDRLHRCGHDLQYYDKVIFGKNIKNLDLVR